MEKVSPQTTPEYETIIMETVPESGTGKIEFEWPCPHAWFMFYESTARGTMFGRFGPNAWILP